MHAFSRESMSGFIGFPFACELRYRLSGKTEWRHGFVSSRADEKCTLSMRCFIGNSHTIEIPRYRQPTRQRYATLSTTRALTKETPPFRLDDNRTPIRKRAQQQPRRAVTRKGMRSKRNLQLTPVCLRGRRHLHTDAKRRAEPPPITNH